jgi:hypothetical protein
MARAIAPLKDVTVRKATKPGMLADGGGLYLRIGPTGGKSWVFRYRRAGRLHDVGLGPLHTVGLADARQKALEHRQARLNGIDPLERRRAGRAAAVLDAARAISFAACAQQYIDSHKAGWRNAKHAAQWPASLDVYVYPVSDAMACCRLAIRAFSMAGTMPAASTIAASAVISATSTVSMDV